MGKLSHFFSKLFPSSNKILFFSILQEKNVCLFLVKWREKSTNDCLMMHLRLFSSANKLGG